jgi:hypothetical protein
MMDDKEAIEMMQRCISEIETQRMVVSRLAPQAEAYEVIRDIVRMGPKQSQGYGEDLVWRLKKKIAELEPKPEAPNAIAE